MSCKGATYAAATAAERCASNVLDCRRTSGLVANLTVDSENKRLLFQKNTLEGRLRLNVFKCCWFCFFCVPCVTPEVLHTAASINMSPSRKGGKGIFLCLHARTTCGTVREHENSSLASCVLPIKICPGLRNCRTFTLPSLPLLLETDQRYNFGSSNRTPSRRPDGVVAHVVSGGMHNL